MASLVLNPVSGFIDHRIRRAIENNCISPSDAILFGIAGIVGALPESSINDVGLNAPLYEHEPSTWCNHCRAQYWGARCPCGRV